MKPWQTLVKYGAIALAVVITVNIAVWSLTALGFIFKFSSDGTSDEARVFEFTEDIEELELEISAAKVTVSAENCDKITVSTNLKNLTAKESGGKLTVKEKQSFITVTHSDAYIELVLPSDLVFDKVDIDGGAGRLEIKSLRTLKLDLDLGAGEALINALDVSSSADIDGGAGSLTVTDSVINNFDLDMGVGELKLEALLGGGCEISLGVGEADITLLGGRENYKLVLEKGIGEIYVDGERVGNTKIGDGACKVDIDGGIGEINVRFSGIDDKE